MKRVIGIICTLVLLLAVYATTFVPKTVEVKQEVNVKAIDTVVYPDYSSLYTLRTDYNTDTCIDVNIQDAQLLMKIARAEGGPTLDGQLWSMRTVFNRLSNGSFGNTIWEIVSADKQFEVFTNGSYINADVNINSHIALAMIEGGWDKTDGALYWHADSSADGSWHDRNLQYIQTVEGNRYYK